MSAVGGGGTGTGAPTAGAGAPGAGGGAPVVLDVADLSVRFGAVAAVRGVGFRLRRGEVLGIVGESGSGKSVTALAVLGLLPDGATVTGSVRLDGTELLGAPESVLNPVRGRRIAMVFQDPLSAFTPVYRIGDQIAEAVLAHQDVSRDQAARRAVELLDLVGIPEPQTRAAAFPHEFSGGMRQRAMIAMAVANDPEVILADEPTTALDVTIQAQVLDVLRTAQRATGAALVLVSHDLGVIAGTADRVAVMYAGRIVESAPVDELFGRPRMPYTLGLLGAVPRLDGAGRPGRDGHRAGVRGALVPQPLVPVPGAPPAADALPAGCSFAPRCPLAEPACRAAEPDLQHAVPGTAAPEGTVSDETVPEGTGAGGRRDGEHLVACRRAAEIVERGLGPADVFPVPPVPTAAAVRTGPFRSPRPSGPTEPSGPSGPFEETGPSGKTVPAGRGTPSGGGAPGPVLRVRALTKTFPLYRGVAFRRRTGSVFAVDGVDLDIGPGETLGLVGESGSGKSTTLFEILGLGPPESGEIEVLGHSTRKLTKRQRRELRSRIQIVFQDPMASLDPRMPVADIVAEPLRALGAGRGEIRSRVPELLDLVGLEPSHAARFPHEFSGGQRQRIGIARALAVGPDLVVLDEPVSALDVSVQAGVLNLLQRLKAELGLAYLFVSHDLSVIRHIADRVSVMYTGRTVEAGAVDDVFAGPRHPYTQALLSAVPLPDPPRERARERILLAGDPPSAVQQDVGCRFRGRCPVYAGLGGAEQERCERTRPALDHGAGGRPDGGQAGGGHVVACHFSRARAVV